MERKADFPPKTGDTPDFLRHVQAALKRHRPLCKMPSNVSRARRVLVNQSESLKNVAPVHSGKGDNGGKGFQKGSGKGSMVKEMIEQRRNNVDAEETLPEESSITLPSFTGTMTTTHNENIAASRGLQREESRPRVSFPDNSLDGGLDRKNERLIHLSRAVFQSDSMDGMEVKLSLVGNANSACSEAPSQGADERMASDTRINHLSSHLSSVALTEGVYSVSDRAELLSLNNQDLKQRDSQHMETADMSMRSFATDLSAKTSTLVHDQQHSVSFLGKDVVRPMTQSSVAGSSCVTTTSVHSLSAPMLTSMTYNPLSNRHNCSQMEMDSLDEFESNPKPVIQGASVLSSGPSFQCSNGLSGRQTAVSIQVSSSAPETLAGVQDNSVSKGNVLVDGVADHPKAVRFDEKSTKGNGVVGDATDMQSQTPLTNNPSSSVNLEPSQSSKTEKAIGGRDASVPRKKNYDTDVFFKVNGKFYQKLGKIGSGGSSEVYKVISNDCTIYALKRIKLKGRDYSTAYGFCQEIEYLNKLKGKKNIIQLIDYEVTDKTLFAEVMNGSMNIKDGRIKNDGHIYMVLEYGEIDLAQMLAQKWKGMDSSTWEIDENWLRFYWQQILHAVFTIHEERIVHSDLKPANFILVKGLLKLIDFGIAKAIMSDTTNIQRDSQVGTLNYMAPEAFMWNEHDANGNIIKCGRPSDIWSLGCILYQMVYGRTPFAEYKTFWAKFKVITDQNHEIRYDPVSNPWLLDLMKKCLAWERMERWRIPQLLQHPFLVPPIQPQLPTSQEEQSKLLMQMAEAYATIPEVSRLCSQLQQLISNIADSSM